MTDVSLEVAKPFQWTIDAFLAADESGAFDGGRVQLVDGQIWSTGLIGDWHGDIVVALIALYRDAVAVGERGSKVEIWSPADVELVIEVSDTSRSLDLGPKAALYASAGYRCYWVVTADEIVVHTDPGPAGYATRVAVSPGQEIAYRDRRLSVAEILSS